MNKLDTATDDLLIERARDGDVAAFESLARRYALLMRSYASRLLGSQADAEDVVQDSLVAAWTTLDKIKDPSKAKSWLMRIVSFKSTDLLRQRKQHDDIDNVVASTREADSPERAALVGSQMEALSEALQRLPEAQRQCWALREMGELSYQEIADQLELSPTAVRGQLSRARIALVREMEGWR
ncbi:sigma-70 family RNA polymerase sigma factor [Acaricomes phytoseiuli]|uniref:RNA polymerase sigma factor n=1 Tax=Acaricomes phytoseiuli TaxID=291968 RepID=UPI0006844129|nr:sigma-70 family RNA polymerase sigma factor [Acaricomes phytoseiuli]MCW1250210.1 sigma-70 family RNA polymerase sigma factor [Acaricomes phytoseiuli]